MSIYFFWWTIPLNTEVLIQQECIKMNNLKTLLNIDKVDKDDQCLVRFDKEEKLLGHQIRIYKNNYEIMAAENLVSSSQTSKFKNIL